MATGRRLLEESMPHNYKQGCLYPTHYLETEEKSYGNTKKRNVRHVRKMGQSKVRKQLKKDLEKELENIEEETKL